MAAEWPSQCGFNTIAVGQRVGSTAPADGAGDLNWVSPRCHGDVMGSIASKNPYIHRKTIGKWWFSMGFYGGLMEFNMIYPLVMSTVSYWSHGHRNSGFSHWKWWFSIVMLVYQRVYPNSNTNRFYENRNTNECYHQDTHLSQSSPIVMTPFIPMVCYKYEIPLINYWCYMDHDGIIYVIVMNGDTRNNWDRMILVSYIIFPGKSWQYVLHELVGGLEPWNFMTFHRLGMENHPNFPETVGNGKSSQLTFTHSIIFQRGWLKPPTRKKNA